MTASSLKTEFSLRCGKSAIGILALSVLYGCARSPTPPQNVTQACDALAKVAANQEVAFVARVQAIRSQHILLQGYDRQMIAVLDDYRKAIQSTLLTDASVDDGVAGCSGQRLEELRWNAVQEMSLLQGFINDFRRSIQEDPGGVFIDSP
jgi:hypothetical protein